MELLKFNEVKKSFDKKEVLKGVSFSVNGGDIFGLVGTSGGGKSTLLKIIVGLDRQDSGDIMFKGKKAHKDLKNLRGNTGFATQSSMIFDELTVRENAHYFGSLYGMKKKEVDEKLRLLLRLLNLDNYENFLVSTLSGGMVKRANFLISLIHSPKLLLLDEPTVGLDSILREALWRYIREINKSGTTVFVTSHLLDEIEDNCNKIAVMKGGKIVSVGSPQEYKNHFGKKSFDVIFEDMIKNESI